MESKKINELMASRGYTKPIGAIFSDWEFVKDEILLPNRKSGSGNGTVHVYLMEDNMNIFQECFPEYIQAVGSGKPEAKDLCPRIKHFVLTANVLTVAGMAYDHYQLDDSSFDYPNYVNALLSHDDKGMITFESLFKLSTDNRPYFKQFDREVFGKIIRYVFVPKKTAYKLYLFGDTAYSNFAAFWVIGQIPDDSFIVDMGSSSKVSFKPLGMATETNTSKQEVSSKDFTLTQEEEAQKNAYMGYLRKKGKSENTVTTYTNTLWKKLSNLIRDYYKSNFRNIFAVKDCSTLLKIENDIWKITEINEADKKSKGKMKMAFSEYSAFVQSELSDEELVKSLFGGNDTENASLIIEQVGKKQQYTSHIPVYSLRAACGRFEDEENAEIEGWIDAEKINVKASKDLFVIHAKGDSMEPEIHDGDLCVFRWYDGGNRQNSIVLTQLASIDPDYDGLYTIKKYHCENSFNPYGRSQNAKVELRSLNPKYKTITLTAADENESKTIGIFLKTL